MSRSPHDIASKKNVEIEQANRKNDVDHYTMNISRRTVDKLGVKLYDRASAVVAELVANAYDADAEEVRVKIPLATLLGNVRTNKEEGTVESKSCGYGQENIREEVIEVIDNGHGMDPTEANEHFLVVGKDRRESDIQGPFSRVKERAVTGRKGIGKLAPFGICNRIEVRSSGGTETPQGYLTSHFILNYEEIIQDTEDPYYPKRGDEDRTYSNTPGTVIRLTSFHRKRVPDEDTFLRQLARRFGARQTDFQILVEDIKDPDSKCIKTVEPLNIPVVEETRIDVGQIPVVTDDGVKLQVSGWVGMAKKGYKHEELAGVRLYARKKIVGSTRDFGLMSGFTGENTLRSYLVGEIHAEWLDEDVGEDLIRTDRQDILWESDRGQALSRWGQDLLKQLGTLTRKPRRDNVRTRFLEIAQVEQRAREMYTDESIIDSALDLAGKIGGFAAEDELSDEEYINGLREVILTVAPHQALMEAFREFRNRIDPEITSFDSLSVLFDKTRVAELASYSQIVAERVAIIKELREVVDAVSPERNLQDLVSKAPWIIEPTWTVLTANQTLRTFAQSFESHWNSQHGEELTISIGHAGKRPDFTALEVGSRLRVVELKRPGHKFGGEDMLRLQNYIDALREYFDQHATIREAFPHGWQIDLVVDEITLTDTFHKVAFNQYIEHRNVVQLTWNDFISRAERANEEFLKIHHASVEERAKLNSASQD